MTYEEALEITQKCLEEARMIPEAFSYGYLFSAEQALEKQIQKKPIPRDIPLCPECGNKLDRTTPYCDMCGQKIDWIENEEWHLKMQYADLNY